MRAFVVSVVVAVVLAIGAAFVLDGFQEPVEQAFSTQGVRL